MLGEVRMKKKKMHIIVAVLMVVTLSLTNVYSLNAQAANPAIPPENMEIFRQWMNDSRELISMYETFGFDIDEIRGLSMPEEFFDKGFDELFADVDVSSQTVQSYALPAQTKEIEYQPIFEKQMEVIVKAAKESIARGYSDRKGKPLNMKDEAIYMFIAHYIDGTGGLDMYLSEYGYQSWNMADWVCDTDRDEFDKLINGMATRDKLYILGDVVDILDTGRQGVSALSDATSGIKFIVSSVLSEAIIGSLPSPEEFDYSQLVGVAKAGLEESANVTEFQDNLMRITSTEYEHLGEATVKSLVTLMTAMVFGEKTSSLLVDLTVTAAIGLTYLSADLYNGFNRKRLDTTRNVRVSERVCDYMEYNGYW